MYLLKVSDIAQRLLARTVVILFAVVFTVSCGQKSESESQAQAQPEATNTEATTEQAASDQEETSANEKVHAESNHDKKASTDTKSASAEHTETKHADTKSSQETLTKKPTEHAKTKTVRIPAGMNVVISLVESIETGQINTGDEFSGTLVDPIVIGDQTVFPAGTAVSGLVVNAVASGRLKTDAELSLTLQSIAEVDVQTDVIEDKASSHAERNKKLIGGGAIVGGILGALKGKDVKGAIAGAAAGAAAGTGAAALTGKKNLVYEAGTLLQFTLAEPVKAHIQK